MQAGPPLEALLDAAAHAARLGAWGGDPATAAAVLLDVGAACLALHAAGRAHGALSASAVMIDGEARARLLDPPVTAPLAGAAPDPAADARAYAGLVRSVLGAWVPAGDPFGDVLDRAAALAGPEAGTPDLGRAVEVIRRAANDRLPGWEQRPRLRRAVAAWESTQPPSVPVAELGAPVVASPGATMVDAPSPRSPVPGGTVVDPPAALAAPPASGATVVDPPPSAMPPAAPSSGPRYRLGGAAPPAAPTPTPPPPAAVPPPPPAPAPLSGPIRIGGPPVALAAVAVPAGPAAAPAWPEVPRRRRGRRLLKAAALVLVALVIALVLAVLLGGHAGEPGLRVLRAQVSTATPQLDCGGQAVVAGVITTNGEQGEIQYEWSRSDGVPTDGRHTQTVPAGATSVPVSFALTVTGTGELREDISLTILTPARLGPFTATIAYRCTGG